MPPFFGEGRPDIQCFLAWDRLKKTDSQGGGHGLYSFVEKAMRHRSVEQSADHAPVQHVGIALPLRVGHKTGEDRIFSAGPKLQTERLILPAHHA